MHSVVNRHESRGAHAREDDPEQDDEHWMKHTLAQLDDVGTVTFDYKLVTVTTMTDEVESVPPTKKVY